MFIYVLSGGFEDSTDSEWTIFCILWHQMVHLVCFGAYFEPFFFNREHPLEVSESIANGSWSFFRPLLLNSDLRYCVRCIFYTSWHVCHICFPWDQTCLLFCFILAVFFPDTAVLFQAKRMAQVKVQSAAPLCGAGLTPVLPPAALPGPGALSLQPSINGTAQAATPSCPPPASAAGFVDSSVPTNPPGGWGDLVLFYSTFSPYSPCCIVCDLLSVSHIFFHPHIIPTMQLSCTLPFAEHCGFIWNRVTGNIWH